MTIEVIMARRSSDSFKRIFNTHREDGSNVGVGVDEKFKEFSRILII